jgi:acyl carrier protein
MLVLLTRSGFLQLPAPRDWLTFSVTVHSVTRCHPSIRPGGVVAFAVEKVDRFQTARESLAVVVELKERGTEGAPKRKSWAQWRAEKSLALFSSRAGGFAVWLFGLFTVLVSLVLPSLRCLFGVPSMCTHLFVCSDQMSAVLRWIPFHRQLASFVFTIMSGAGLSAGAGVGQKYNYSSAELDGIVSAARKAVLAQFSVAISDLVLVRARTVPKTSSGKLRNRDTRSALLSGAFDANTVRRSCLDPPTDVPATAATPMAVAGLLVKTPGGSASSFRVPRPHIKQEIKTPSAGTFSHLNWFDRRIENSPIRFCLICVAAQRLAVMTDHSAPLSGKLLTPNTYRNSEFATPKSAHPWSLAPSAVPPLDLSEVKAVIREALSAEFGITGVIDESRTLDTMGMDSLRAVALTKKLADHYKLPLSVFMFLSEPTVEGVAKAVLQLHSSMHSSTSVLTSAGWSLCLAPFASLTHRVLKLRLQMRRTASTSFAALRPTPSKCHTFWVWAVPFRLSADRRYE